MAYRKGVTGVADGWLEDDEALLDALAEALRADSDIPDSFREAASAAYAWQDIDAELAALIYDSARAEREPALTRAEPAGLRALTFSARRLSVELHLSDGALSGQVVPPQPGEAEVHTARGGTGAVPIDEVGYFRLAAVPTGPFRVHIRTADGASVLTDRIVL
jgi:hypothetical protein